MRPRSNLRRSRCTSSALALATVLAIGATPAKAQSLQGTGTFVTNTGGAADITPDVNTTTITLNPGQTVIDWTPFDNAVGNFGGIAFQYDGSTATFQSSGNFAVLNRINVADVTRIVSMDGDINGLVGGQTGGSIYFYSPSGFVLGANATINVGSLVLSASPITVDGNGLFISGPNNSVTFGQAVNPNAAVNTVGAFGQSPGASITASDYVAFVAPRVEHQGTINVAGQAALVAAEAATIDFTPDGLFNIQITSGTTDSEGVRIGGEINGPASDGSTNHRIYAVAVPKNQLMTMTIAGGANLGFDIAGAANVDGNAIVLSAGYNVVGGQADNSNPFVNGNQASILWNGSNATSALTGTANRRAELSVTGNVTSDFASNVTMIGGVSADVGAYTPGAVLNIAGDVTVRADQDLSGTPNANATAGSAILIAQNGGDVNVGGNVTVTANATGGNNSTPGGTAGSGTGGTAQVLAQNGTTPGSDMFIGGSVTVQANGTGGTSFVAGTGGTGRGGFVGVQAAGAGTSLVIDGSNVVVSADGTGGSVNCTLCGGFGGGGFGGDAFLATTSGAAGSPAVLSVDGASYVSTNATGGYGDAAGGNAIGGGVAGSSGEGAVVTFGANSSINLIGGLTIESNGSGGNSDGTGGNGTGGRTRTGAQNAATGGSLTIGGLMEASVRGFGGNGGTGNGGIGRGGQADNGGNSGTISYNNVNILADAFGGTSGSGTGGAAFGGTGWIDGFGSVISVAGYYSGFAQATGGDGASGGAATGGSIFLVGRSGLTVGGIVELYADARGGDGFNSNGAGNGGNATGGTADVRSQTGSSMTLADDVFVYAEASGGNAAGTGIAGNATGGQALVRGLTGSNLDLLADVYIYANAFGGYSDLGGTSGNATGGTATFAANASTVDLEGSAFLGSFAYGGSNDECFTCGGVPGDATGGLAQIFSTGAAGQMTVNGDAFITSNGYGGRSAVGIGGDGIGGRTYLSAASGSTTLISGSAFLDAQGRGASVDFGTAGDGTGGLAQVSIGGTTDASVFVNGDLYLDTSGYGGGSFESSALAGGDGIGGISLIYVPQGTVDVDGETYLAANGYGGSILDGTGGDGTGGGSYLYVLNGALAVGSGDLNANLSAIGQGGSSYEGVGGNAFGGQNSVDVNGTGSIAIAGNLNMDASSTGGSGTTGGNATGLTSPSTDELQPTAGIILVRGPGGGSITIGGAANLNADAHGGDGAAGEIQGDGGDALAGELDVNSRNGTITMNGLNISATAYGGRGGEGGNGGDATAGLFDVTFGPNGQPLNGTLNLGDVSIIANAFGGAGGNGIGSFTGPGGAGGNGGSAFGNTDSVNQFTANAAGGTLNAETVSISLQTYGGAGGTGGASPDDIGGDGGSGGSAQGGFVQTGSISNGALASAGGAFTLASLAVDTSTHGGAGGNGGLGATIGGDGGAGGSAGTLTGGSSFLGIRGMVGNVGNVLLYSNATGGDGGSGGEGANASGVAGAGGDAVSGRIEVESRERFGVPSQRGLLVAANIYGESIAIGGTGSVAGSSTSSGGNSFLLYNGDADIGSFQFVIRGDNASSVADFIAIVDGAATIDGPFNIETTNPLALYANRTNTTLNQASLTATTVNLDAATFVSFPGNEVTGTEIDPATRPGTFFADTWTVTTGGDFYTTANIDSVNFFEIIAPGSITAFDIAGQNAVNLNAQSGLIVVNDIDAALEIRLNAATGIAANDLTSGTYIYASTGDQLTVNNVLSATSTALYGSGGVTFATVEAGSDVQLASNGLIQGGSTLAGGSIYGFTDGSIDLGDLSAGTWIELVAFGDIDVASAIAGESIELDTSGYGDPGGYIHTGNLTAGDSIDVSAGTDAELGNLSAGIVNPSVISGGTYTIGVLANDHITAGTIDTITHSGLASGGAVTTGTVDVDGIFMVLAGGDVATGPITTGQDVYIADFSMMPLGGTITGAFDPAPILAASPVATGGSITIGGPVEAGDFRAAAGTNLTAQDITSAGVIDILSNGSTAVGVLDAGTSLLIQANAGPIITADARAGTTLSLRSTGNVTAGDLVAGTAITLGSNGQILVGDMTSGGTIDARSVGAATYGNISVTDDLYVGANAALTFGNMVAGETARFGSDTSVSGGNVTAGDSVIGTSGGNITLGDLSAGIVDQSANPGALYEAVVFGIGNVAVGAIAALGEVQLAGRTGITAGNITTPSRMFAVSNGSIVLGNLNIAGNLLIGAFDMFDYIGDLRTDFDASPTFDSAPIAAAADLTVGAVDANGLSLAVLGNLVIGDVDAFRAIRLDAGGSLTAGNLQSLASSVTLMADGNIVAGDVTAGGAILVDAGGNVATGHLIAGVDSGMFGIGTQDVGPGSPVEVFGNDVVTGEIVADGYVGLYAQGTLQAGPISAFHDIIALAGGTATFSDIVTNERFILAGIDNLAALLTPAGGFNPEAIFSLFPPMSTGGNAVYGGAVNVSTFESYVGGNTSAGPVRAASYALIDSGGTITLNGPVSAQDYVGLTSADIDIGANASVSANAIGFISTSANGTFIGDNTGASGGYRLSQAELDRTDAQTYEFEVSTDRGALASMIVGDLTLDMTGSFYEDVAEFWIGNNQTEVTDGTIRMVGDTTIRVTPDQEVSFLADTFEIDAATGSLALLDGQNNLSGYLAIDAPNIFIASSDILAKLEADPRYAGYVAELNAPAAVQRPEGVLRAASIDIDSSFAPIANILVQNTGTTDLPAGFVLTAADIGDADGGDGGLPPNSINLVINGQIVAEGGTLTGIAVRDLLVSEFGTEPFVVGSTINGCLLAGGCTTTESIPPSAVVTPTQIDLLANDPLGESDFGNEPDIDDNVDGDAGDSSSPIEAPQPLFDSRPLIDSSLVDDPISGAGNPSLYGASDADDDDKDDDDKDEEGDKGKGSNGDKKGDGQ